MSIPARMWAQSQADITDSTHLFVLLELADHAGDHAGEDWTCYPSIERLMWCTRKSRSAVERALKWLEAEGFISRQRRRLPGGRLGIYDYVLHRERNLAAPALQAGVDTANGPEGAGDHASKRRVDHASDQAPTMRQNGASPYVTVTHVDEPPLEPPIEPPLGARARVQVQVWASELWRLWPQAGQDASSPQLVDAAMATVLGRGADAAAVLAGARAYCGDKSAWGASGRPLSPHKFLSEGRWQTFADRTPGGEGGALDARRALFPDAAIRAAFVKAFGEGAAVSYLDRAGWDGERRRIHPHNSISAGWWRGVADELRGAGLTVGDVRKGDQ